MYKQKKINMLEKIKTAMLSGQRVIKFGNIEVFLPILDRDTQKRRELSAEKKANEILKVLEL